MALLVPGNRLRPRGNTVARSRSPFCSIDDGGATALAPVTLVRGVDAASAEASLVADPAGGLLVLFEVAGDRRVARVSGIGAPATATVLAPSTNASVANPLHDATAVTGCPEVVRAPVSLDRPCPCTGTAICVVTPSGASVCEQPVVHRTPQQPGECQTHAECSDGIACNGVETCEPRRASDARGCMPAAGPQPCGDARCDETNDVCLQYSAPTACSFGPSAAAFVTSTTALDVALGLDGCAAGRVRPGILQLGGTPYVHTLWAATS